MNRRSLMALGLALVVPKPAAAGLGGKEFLEAQLVTSTNAENSSMEEICARFAYVTCGHQLPPEARRRTLLRAESEKQDKVGPFGFREDISIVKRSLCYVILELDRKLQ